MRTWYAAAAGIAGVASMVGAGAGGAAEITVLTNMGVVSAVRDLAPAFERASGHKVTVQFEIGPAFAQKIDADAPADLVTHYPDSIDDLIAKGKVVAGTRTDFARGGIGVVVKAGAPKPDIGTPDAFKHAMLTAKSIAYSRTGASGIYMAKLMARLGIADAMKDRTRLIEGMPVADVVAKGDVEIGMQQINTLLNVAGTDYVGPLPGDLQGYVAFAAGLLVIAKEPEAAKAMLKFIVTPEAVPLIKKRGMEPAT